MRYWYLKYCDVHHTDTTFQTNLENFLLHISLVVDSLGHGLPTAYAFMKSSSAENLEFFYQYLTGKTVVDDEVIIVDQELAAATPVVNIIDKDLTNIQLLKKYYPRTKILLCTFHVIKWFKTLINNKEILDGAKQAEKNRLVELLRLMV